LYQPKRDTLQWLYIIQAREKDGAASKEYCFHCALLFPMRILTGGQTELPDGNQQMILQGSLCEEQAMLFKERHANDVPVEHSKHSVMKHIGCCYCCLHVAVYLLAAC
jgi:hypothetical protein